MFRSRFHLKPSRQSTVSKPWTACAFYRGVGGWCTELFFASQTGRANLLLLSKAPGETGGAIRGSSCPMADSFVLTLVVEIIPGEIVDETDRYEDNRHKKRTKRICRNDERASPLFSCYPDRGIHAVV